MYISIFIFSFTIKLIHFFTFTLVHMLSSNALTPPCASFLHACRSKYLVCICRKLTKRMYFVAYLVVGFNSLLHLSSFNINTNIHMKGECKTAPSLCKRGGGWGGAFIFLTKSLCYSDFLQYTWSGILTLIKIIHVPQSITMRVTPPCVRRTALFRPRLLHTVEQQNNHFRQFHSHTEDKMTVCCVRMYNHSCKR